MPRIRTLKPEFWQDEKMAPLDVTSRLVFVALISLADDAGRLIDNLRLLDASIFPETDDTCREALATLSRIGRIERGKTHAGQQVIQIVNWSKHQKIDHPNLKAALPELVDVEGLKPLREGRAKASRKPRETLAHHTNDQRPATSDQGPVPKAPRKRSALEKAEAVPGVDVPPDGVSLTEWVPPVQAGDDGAALALFDDSEFVPFTDHETLRRDHPRVLAYRKTQQVPSRPPLIPSNGVAQLNILWERWRYRVGEIEYGRWRKSVAPALTARGFHAMWNAIEAFHEERLLATPKDRQFLTVTTWLNQLPYYIAWGLKPMYDEQNKPTERRRRFMK